jgi:hypothetical protein
MKVKIKKHAPRYAGKDTHVMASRRSNPFVHVRVLEPSANVEKHASVTTAEIDRAIRQLNAPAGE